jgi:hypothetical protein
MKFAYYLGAGEMAEGSFKRDNGGWIYKAPFYARLFGAYRAYRVTDTQKEQLKELFARTYGYTMISLAAVVSFAIPVMFFLSGGVLGWKELTASAVGGLIIGLASWAFYVRAMRKVVTPEQATTENISYAESMRSYAAAMPLWRGFAYLAVSLCLLGASVFAWFEKPNPYIDVFGVAMFAFCTLIFAGIVIKKLMGR